MKKPGILALCAVLMLMSLRPTAVYPCGFQFTFRSYLDKRFWQPFSKYEKSLDMGTSNRQLKAAASQPQKRKSHTFAGMSEDPCPEALEKVRDAYGAGDLDQARTAIEVGARANLSESEREELLLVDAKVDLRQGEAEPKNRQLLRRAESKLSEFVKTARTASWRSEARGWLARTHYLLDEFAPAAKIYLDELSSGDSVYSRESLIVSLRTLFPYNGSSARLADHLEEYFDTPEHALFVVNILTNPVFNDDRERAAMGTVAQKAIDALLGHRELFRSGGMSDQLALALMRASLYRGDTRSALSYSGLIAGSAEAAATPEYNWMLAACYFLLRDYKAAEAPLLRILNSGQAGPRDRNAAAQGLIGVYQKTGRRAAQLHAAFLYEQSENDDTSGDECSENMGHLCTSPYIGFNYWPMGGTLFDFPYLLDVQLTDDELMDYLGRYGTQGSRMRFFQPPHRRTACEIVRYTLAVRYARREQYRKAAEIYESLHARPRALRMRELARLHADAVNKAFTPQRHFDAQYAYAAFLEEHSTQVYFNDMVWYGFQTLAFLSYDPESDGSEDDKSSPKGDQGYTREEREFFAARERMIRDEQEERWRAYKILTAVVDQAGHSEIGGRAARKALKCLRFINKRRFGREKEINAAEKRLLKWLGESVGSGLKE